MESERKRVANELRSTGSAEGEKIKADADRQKQVIVAEAYRDAQRIKGEGDAQAARIYAEAYGRNAEFYSFYRSLEAYRAALRTKGDVMVLEPTSDFFKYLKNPGRGSMGPGGGRRTVRGFRAHAGDRGIMPFVAPKLAARLSGASRDEDGQIPLRASCRWPSAGDVRARVMKALAPGRSPE